MKIGTRVEVAKENARTWGYKTPAYGTVIGPDPLHDNPEIVAVRLDQGNSIYETNGVHLKRLKERTNE